MLSCIISWFIDPDCSYFIRIKFCDCNWVFDVVMKLTGQFVRKIVMRGLVSPWPWKQVGKCHSSCLAGAWVGQGKLVLLVDACRQFCSASLLLYTSRKYVAFTVLLLLLLEVAAAAAAAASGGKKHHQLKQHLPACFTLLLQTWTTFFFINICF